MKKNPVYQYINETSRMISCAGGPYPVSAVKYNGTVRDEYLSAHKKEVLDSWNRKKDVIAAAGSGCLRAVLKSDGRVCAYSIKGESGLQNQAAGWRQVKEITAAEDVLIAVRQDGTVSAFCGSDIWMKDVAGRLKDVRTLAAGSRMLAVLCRDGSARIYSGSGMYRIKEAGGNPFRQLVCGSGHAAGRREDGSVLSWGDNTYGQCGTSSWKEISRICCGTLHTAGLCRDGSAVAAGDNRFGQCRVEGWDSLVSICCGSFHTVGLRADGTVAACGDNTWGQCDTLQWKDMIAVSAGPRHTVGIRRDGLILRTDGTGRGKLIPWKLFHSTHYSRYEMLHQRYSPVFLKLACRCSEGDSEAMLQMYHWFRSQAPAESSGNTFFWRAACTWLARACRYGNQEAEILLKMYPQWKAYSFFPEEMLAYGSRSQVRIHGRNLRDLGFLEAVGDAWVTIHGLTEEGMYYYDIYAGWEGPDEDGFGMEEEHYRHMYDEFFNYIGRRGG